MGTPTATYGIIRALKSAPPPVSPPPFTPADLAGLAPAVEPAKSLAEAKLWQDAAKTVAAAADGDIVRAATSPYSAADYAADSDAASPLLWDEAGGKWSIAFDGVDDRFAMPAGTAGAVAWGFAWVNQSAVPAGNFVIPASPNGGIELGLFNGVVGYKNVSFIFGGNGTASGFDAAAAIGTGAWNVLVVTYNGGGVSAPGNYRAWLNGVEQAVVASDAFGGGAAGTLGCRGGGAFPAPMRVAGFIPSSVALSEAEALSLSAYLAALHP